MGLPDGTTLSMADKAFGDVMVKGQTPGVIQQVEVRSHSPHSEVSSLSTPASLWGRSRYLVHGKPLPSGLAIRSYPSFSTGGERSVSVSNQENFGTQINHGTPLGEGYGPGTCTGRDCISAGEGRSMNPDSNASQTARSEVEAVLQAVVDGVLVRSGNVVLDDSDKVQKDEGTSVITEDVEVGGVGRWGDEKAKKEMATGVSTTDGNKEPTGTVITKDTGIATADVVGPGVTYSKEDDGVQVSMEAEGAIGTGVGDMFEKSRSPSRKESFGVLGVTSEDSASVSKVESKTPENGVPCNTTSDKSNAGKRKAGSGVSSKAAGKVCPSNMVWVYGQVGWF